MWLTTPLEAYLIGREMRRRLRLTDESWDGFFYQPAHGIYSLDHRPAYVLPFAPPLAEAWVTGWNDERGCYNWGSPPAPTPIGVAGGRCPECWSYPLIIWWKDGKLRCWQYPCRNLERPEGREIYEQYRTNG